MLALRGDAITTKTKAVSIFFLHLKQAEAACEDNLDLKRGIFCPQTLGRFLGGGLEDWDIFLDVFVLSIFCPVTTLLMIREVYIESISPERWVKCATCRSDRIRGIGQ